MSSKLFVPDLLDGHAVLRKHRRIDLLVNNAGGQYLTPAEDITPKGFRTVIRLNVKGTWLMTHAVATKAMIPESRGGKIPAGDYFSGAILTLHGARDNWFGRWPPHGVADETGKPLAEERRRRS
jgi:hypothetical protein